MAKSRKKKKARKAAAKRRPAKASKRKVKKAPRRKAKRRTAKRKQEGVLETLIGTAEDAVALRRRLVGRDSFEDT